MTPEEQSEKDRYEVKIQKVANGFVVRMRREWFVFTTLPEVFALITAHFKDLGQKMPNNNLRRGVSP